MEKFGVGDMLEMQHALQEKYKDRWEKITPRAAKHKLLWMIGEAGEVIDIIKKHSADQIVKTPELRAELIEELADVLMYYNDVLLCYGITEEELRETYTKKFEYNMTRW